MAYFLRTRKLDLSTGSTRIAILNEEEAWHYGIRAGDHLKLIIGRKAWYVSANTTKTRVKPGQIGLYRDVWEDAKIADNSIAEIRVQQTARSIRAIKKRLLGKRLTYAEFEIIISDIVEGIVGKIPTTYFVASAFMHEYSDQELYYLTKAMAMTGDTMSYRGLVADKHSVGGLAGNRTSMIVIPIIAAAGVKIPKTSSRAITSPSGTADTMEVLAPVSFGIRDLKRIVQQANACLAWGGGVSLAPADDKIIQVSYPLSLEPYSKMIVSIMAKKIAAGVNHLIIDMPVGPTTKIPDMKTATELERKFKYVASRFGIKIKVLKTRTTDPVGQGIGPALEARDVLRVLQQKSNRPGDLQNKSLHLAGELLELTKKARLGHGATLAWRMLDSGRAWKKMQEIIKLQGGKPDIDSESITLAAHKKYYTALKSGRISFIDNKGINYICRTLGAPSEKLAGIYLNKEYGVRVAKGERLFTIYAASNERLRLAAQALKKLKIFKLT